MFKKILLLAIGIYQLVFSPDQGILRRRQPVCRFYPTCSQYAYQAVQKYGVLKGLTAGFKRIWRCHPWSEGGYDPVK